MLECSISAGEHLAETSVPVLGRYGQRILCAALNKDLDQNNLALQLSGMGVLPCSQKYSAAICNPIIIPFSAF